MNTDWQFELSGVMMLSANLICSVTGSRFTLTDILIC